MLLPLVSVQFFQPLVSENFEFFICLLKLFVDGLVVGVVLLLYGVLLVGLVPASHSRNGLDLSDVAAVVSFVLLLLTTLHDCVVRFTQ